MAIWFLVFLSLAEPYANEAVDARIIEIALNHCPNARFTPNTDWMREALKIERKIGVVWEMRGFSLANACHESGFNPTVGGDAGKARGIHQMWSWWREPPLGARRANAWDATRALLLWAGAQADYRARRACGRLRGAKRWRVAWVRAIRSGRRSWCDASPNALPWLEAWRALFWSGKLEKCRFGAKFCSDYRRGPDHNELKDFRILFPIQVFRIAYSDFKSWVSDAAARILPRD